MKDFDIRITVHYSEMNKGYMYEVYDLDTYSPYSSTPHIDWEDMESVRGGLCTGSEEEAYIMAMEEAKDYLLTGKTN